MNLKYDVSYLRYLCLLAHSGVQHISCFVFVLFFFVLRTLCFQFLSGLSILIAPSVFSNVYVKSVKICQTYLIITLMKEKASRREIIAKIHSTHFCRFVNSFIAPFRSSCADVMSSVSLFWISCK